MEILAFVHSAVAYDATNTALAEGACDTQLQSNQPCHQGYPHRSRPMGRSLQMTGLAVALATLTLTQAAIAAPLLKLGDRSNDVAAVQKALGIEADGVFGPATEAAVREFQTRNRLAVDGQVGSATLSALGVELEPTTTPTSTTTPPTSTGGSSTPSAPPTFANAGNGIVKTDGGSLAVRSEPSTSSPAMGYMENGTSFTYTKTVVDSAGQTWLYLFDYGWVRSDFVSTAGGEDTGGPAQPVANEAGSATVSTDGGELTVRKEPSTSSQAISYLANGAPFEYDGLSTDAQGLTWLRLKGLGWVRSDFVKFGTQPKAQNASQGGTTKPIVSEAGSGTVSTDGGDLIVRKDPSTSSQAVSYLANGASFNYAGVSTDAQGMTWLRLTELGWVRSDFVKFGTETKAQNANQGGTAQTIANESGKGVVKTQGAELIVRSGPSTSSAAVDYLPNGSAIEVIGTKIGDGNTKWLQTKTGWVRSDFVTITPAATTPAKTTTAA